MKQKRTASKRNTKKVYSHRVSRSSKDMGGYEQIITDKHGDRHWNLPAPVRGPSSLEIGIRYLEQLSCSHIHTGSAMAERDRRSSTSAERRPTVMVHAHLSSAPGQRRCYIHNCPGTPARRTGHSSGATCSGHVEARPSGGPDWGRAEGQRSRRQGRVCSLRR